MNNTRNVGFKRSQHHSSSGFTLLELMIVIVIVGIMFSFLALSIRSSSPAEAIKTEAQRLNQLIGLAAEEAILRGEEYGIVFKPTSYQFARLTDDAWRLIQDDRQLRMRELPRDITIELEVDKSRFVFSSNQNTDEKTLIEPQVYILSSGEITPEFTINMSIFGVDTVYRIDGKFNGQHSARDNDTDGS